MADLGGNGFGTFYQNKRASAAGPRPGTIFQANLCSTHEKSQIFNRFNRTGPCQETCLVTEVIRSIAIRCPEKERGELGLLGAFFGKLDRIR
jgi:hypothetical protein